MEYNFQGTDASDSGEAPSWSKGGLGLVFRLLFLKKRGKAVCAELPEGCGRKEKVYRPPPQKQGWPHLRRREAECIVTGKGGIRNSGLYQSGCAVRCGHDLPPFF